MKGLKSIIIDIGIGILVVLAVLLENNKTSFWDFALFLLVWLELTFCGHILAAHGTNKHRCEEGIEYQGTQPTIRNAISTFFREGGGWL